MSAVTTARPVLGTLERHVLLALAVRPGPARHSDLAGDLDRTLEQISRALYGLTALGLVERSPAGYRLAATTVISRRGVIGQVVPLPGARG